MGISRSVGPTAGWTLRWRNRHLGLGRRKRQAAGLSRRERERDRNRNRAAPLEPGLLRRAQQGDEKAFATLVGTYHAPVYNYVLRVLGSDRLADIERC